MPSSFVWGSSSRTNYKAGVGVIRREVAKLMVEIAMGALYHDGESNMPRLSGTEEYALFVRDVGKRGRNKYSEGQLAKLGLTSN